MRPLQAIVRQKNCVIVALTRKLRVPLSLCCKALDGLRGMSTRALNGSACACPTPPRCGAAVALLASMAAAGAMQPGTVRWRATANIASVTVTPHINALQPIRIHMVQSHRILRAGAVGRLAQYCRERLLTL